MTEIITHNLEAEQALLGALLLNNSSLEYVNDYLKSEHFSDQLHGRIFDSIQKFIDRGQIADPITLKDFFAKDKTLEPKGGAKYLIDLAESVISIISINDYGRLIHDLFLRRQLIQIGHEIVIESRQFDIDISAVKNIENAEKKLYDLATKGQFSNTIINFEDALTRAIEVAAIAVKRDNHISGISTGLTGLDKYLGGLQPSELLILAGRPSMGKTALATNIAFNAAMTYVERPQEGANVAFFSLEMSAEQLASRILASESKISSSKIKRGEITQDDFIKFIEVSRRIGTLGLYIDDTPALTVTALRNRARRLKRQHNIGLIVIDYLQLLEGSGSKKGNENRVQELSEITRGLKSLAKELNIPVIALSQLSRALETRNDKRPQLSDLRESGSIEQDADVVMFVYREEYYEARKQPSIGTPEHFAWVQQMTLIHNKAEIIIAKQRNGPIGNVELSFDSNLTLFGNLNELL